MPGRFLAVAAVARASATTSSSMVTASAAFLSLTYRWLCSRVLLSYRITAIPRVARPWATSRNGLLGPIVSSRSLGPEP